MKHSRNQWLDMGMGKTEILSRENWLGLNLALSEYLLSQFLAVIAGVFAVDIR